VSNPLLDIRIGTMVRGSLADPAACVRGILALGFESIQPFEGWHDPVYRDALELTGEKRAVDDLKACRGGTGFVANPPADLPGATS
jgi:hypothetical protein